MSGHAYRGRCLDICMYVCMYRTRCLDMSIEVDVWVCIKG